MIDHFMSIQLFLMINYLNSADSQHQQIYIRVSCACHLVFFAFKALIILLGWLQKRPVLEMFTIGVRLVLFSVQLFTLRLSLIHI